MRKAALLLISVIVLALSACQSVSIGIIGGSDGSADIVVSDKDGYEKDSVRMVRINGALYYESGEDNDNSARCGNMDGSFKRTAGKFEVPQNDNGSNFDDASSYQLGAAENTIEILIDDDWEIFAKIDSSTDVLKYKYCFELEGELPNAHDDSKFLVLSDEKDVTFADAAYVLLGSDMSKMKDIYVLPIND